MGKIEKLIAKLKARSSAISFEEAEVLLEYQRKQLLEHLEQEGFL